MARGVFFHLWHKFDHALDNKHPLPFPERFSRGQQDFGAARSRHDLFFDRGNVYPDLSGCFARGMGMEPVWHQLGIGHYRHCLKIGFPAAVQRGRAVFFIFYIIMGWLIIIAWFPLVRAFSQGGIFWLVLGGIFYTAGAGIFNMKRLNFTPYFGAHELWHLFVLAGSFCHFWMMLKYV